MASRVFLGPQFDFIYGLRAVPDLYKRSLIDTRALQQCMHISMKRDGKINK